MPSSVNGHAGTLAVTSMPPEPGNDPLTGLPTRTTLEAELNRRLAQNREDNAARATLALLQLANFYEIRTWVGRSEAELLLTEIAGQLRQVIPPEATLYRCNNYEFALLVPGTPSPGVRNITGHIHRTLKSIASNVIPPQLQLHSAIGLAEVTGDIPRAEILFARARHSLGLNRYGSGTVVPADSPVTVIRRIHHGLRHGGLRLNFQPLLSLRGDPLARYEVRSSLVTGDEQLSGQALYDLAVQNALGETLDHLVIGRSLTILAQNESPALSLLVNLSLNSLVSADFLDWLARRLRGAAGLAPRLFLQISEIDALIAQHYLGQFSEALRELGTGLGIRHFGCSEDPLRYLPLMRTQFVKLHVCRSEGIVAEPNRLQALAALTARLRGRGVRVIAPMVEDPAMLPLLWQARVDIVQGNCLQAPAAQMKYAFPRPRMEA